MTVQAACCHSTKTGHAELCRCLRNNLNFFFLPPIGTPKMDLQGTHAGFPTLFSSESFVLRCVVQKGKRKALLHGKQWEVS